jgi:hypothetical protein
MNEIPMPPPVPPRFTNPAFANSAINARIFGGIQIALRSWNAKTRMSTRPMDLRRSYGFALCTFSIQKNKTYCTGSATNEVC